MKKLYEVTIKLMVFADDEDDAKYVASCADVDACDVEIEKATECLPGWKNAFPFGDCDDDIMCGEIIAKLRKKGA